MCLGWTRLPDESQPEPLMPASSRRDWYLIGTFLVNVALKIATCDGTVTFLQAFANMLRQHAQNPL